MSGCVRPIPELAEPVSTAAGQSIAVLPAVLDPAQLSKHLEFFSSSPWNWGELRDVRVQTLKAHQNRCTVEICLRTTGGLRTLIGKAYAQDRSDVYDAMEAIRRAGFGPDAVRQLRAHAPDMALRELAAFVPSGGVIWGLGNYQGFGARLTAELAGRDAAC